MLLTFTTCGTCVLFVLVYHSHRCGKQDREITAQLFVGGLGDEFKYHLVVWDSLLSYCQWSLGAKKLGSFNQALVGKWSWRFGTDDTFTETGNSYELCWKWWGWISEPFRGTHGCSLWKSIRAGWDRLISYLSFDVGDGNCVQFWYDHWCGNHPLKEFFPSTSAHFV